MPSHDASDAQDESDYPLAPLPAHERTWRHPSEVGQTAWELTEPPVAIGRGLFVATTAVGFVLGVAVLLLLAPMGGTELASTPRAAWPASGATSGTTQSAAPVVNTVLVHHDRPDEQMPDDALPVAVAVSHHGLMITTANALTQAAIGPTDGVSIIGTFDDAAGTVVSVVGSLAFILPSADVTVATFDEIRTAVPGQRLTVLTDNPTEIVYGAQPVGDIDDRGIREGTPVVDGDGALVALCTLTRRSGSLQVDLVPVPHSVPDTGAGEPAPSVSSAAD